MKTILFILMLFTSLLSAQEGLSLGVYQDAKLLTLGDKARGYEAGTIDVLLSLKMQGNEQKLGHLVIYPQFEYAELQPAKYLRYSANIGYNFYLSHKVELMPSIGFGIINRGGMALRSAGASLEGSYNLSKKFKAVAIAQFVDRQDLKIMYNTGGFKYSFFVGFEFKMFDNSNY